MIVKTINNEPKYLSPTNAMLLVDVRKKVKSSFLCADTTILFQVSFVHDIGVLVVFNVTVHEAQRFA